MKLYNIYSAPFVILLWTLCQRAEAIKEDATLTLNNKSGGTKRNLRGRKHASSLKEIRIHLDLSNSKNRNLDDEGRVVSKESDLEGDGYKYVNTEGESKKSKKKKHCHKKKQKQQRSGRV